jgi:hypothetical protein
LTVMSDGAVNWYTPASNSATTRPVLGATLWRVVSPKQHVATATGWRANRDDSLGRLFVETVRRDGLAASGHAAHLKGFAEVFRRIQGLRPHVGTPDGKLICFGFKRF